MTAHTPESVSTHLADRSIFVTGSSTPPRDPKDDDDDVGEEEEEEEEEEDGDAESDEDEPVVIREPDE